MKLDKQTIVWAGSIIAATACCLALISWPQLKQMKDLAAQHKSEQAKQAMSSSSEQEVKQLQREVSTLAAQADDYNSRIPRQDMLGEFLEELAGYAQQRELKTEEIEPGEPIESSEIIALPIKIKLRGSFLNIFALLQDIEKIPRLTRIERFETSIDQEAPDSVMAEMKLSIFYRHRGAG